MEPTALSTVPGKTVDDENMCKEWRDKEGTAKFQEKWYTATSLSTTLFWSSWSTDASGTLAIFQHSGQILKVVQRERIV